MRRLAISVPNAALPTVVTCLKRCRAIPNRLISSSSTRRRWGISFCSTRPLQRTLCEPAAFHTERQSTLHSQLRAKSLSHLFANHHNASLMQAALSDECCHNTHTMFTYVSQGVPPGSQRKGPTNMVAKMVLLCVCRIRFTVTTHALPALRYMFLHLRRALIAEL